MRRSKSETAAIVAQKTPYMSGPAIRAALKGFVIEPKEETRRETCIPSGLPHKCWIVADLHQRDVGIASCEGDNPAHGHLWGMVFLTVDDSIGDRGGRHPILEALYHDFGF